MAHVLFHNIDLWSTLQAGSRGHSGSFGLTFCGTTMSSAFIRARVTVLAVPAMSNNKMSVGMLNVSALRAHTRASNTWLGRTRQTEANRREDFIEERGTRDSRYVRHTKTHTHKPPVAPVCE